MSLNNTFGTEHYSYWCIVSRLPILLPNFAHSAQNFTEITEVAQ